MSNELVKYDPELNTIPLRKFSTVEMNLFFSIISRVRDRGDSTIRFYFNDLKELSDYKPTANKRFIDDISNTYKKILSLTFSKISKNGLNREMFVVFTKFNIVGNVDDPYVDLQIYPEALYLFNDLERWVRFALKEFREIKSSYAKTAFRLIKQYRTTGYVYFKKDTFKELMAIPKSYSPSDINKRIIRPIKNEVTPLIKGLSIRKKYGRGRGKPVIGYSFSWKPESNDSDDFSKGLDKDNRAKIDNIKFNSELTNKEKKDAINKIKGNVNINDQKEKSSKNINDNESIIDDPKFNKDFNDYFNF